MISRASRGQIVAISEVALDLLKGNIMVPSSSFKRLKPHKSQDTKSEEEKRSSQSTRRIPASSRLFDCTVRFGFIG